MNNSHMAILVFGTIILSEKFHKFTFISKLELITVRIAYNWHGTSHKQFMQSHSLFEAIYALPDLMSLTLVPSGDCRWRVHITLVYFQMVFRNDGFPFVEMISSKKFSVVKVPTVTPGYRSCFCFLSFWNRVLFT